MGILQRSFVGYTYKDYSWMWRSWCHISKWAMARIAAQI